MTRFDIECNEIVEPRCQIEKIILECNKNCKIYFKKSRYFYKYLYHQTVMTW